MACETCYKTEIQECPIDVVIFANLLHEADYEVVIENAFGRRFTQAITSGILGTIEIDFTEFDSMFDHHTGEIQIKIYRNGTQVSFSVCGNIYTCFNVDFYKGSGITDGQIKGQCSIISDNETTGIDYFKKVFTFTAPNYVILVGEHLLATEIFSIELLGRIDGVWQNIEFLYTINDDNDITIISDFDGLEMTIIMTGIA